MPIFFSIVSTHSRLKAAGTKGDNAVFGRVSFNTQPPKGGWAKAAEIVVDFVVSTHSRLKAAGRAVGCP